MPTTTSLRPLWAAALAALASGARAEPGAGGAPPCHTLPPPGVERTAAAVAVPPVRLVDQHGAEVDLRALLSSPRPVALDFIFTSCRTICPVLSASLASLHREAGPGVDLVSISIDPEFDRPAVLRRYARRFQAGSGWRLLTGKPEAIAAVVAAFGAGPGDKESHRPLTFVRPAGSAEWVRLEGFPSTRELVTSLRLDSARASR
jgi:protein SCO1/2